VKSSRCRRHHGLIFIVARTIDAVQTPLIGLISDKFTHRGPARAAPLRGADAAADGRRNFYMLFHPPQTLFIQPGLLAAWLFVALFVSISAMPAFRSATTPTARS